MEPFIGEIILSAPTRPNDGADTKWPEGDFDGSDLFAADSFDFDIEDEARESAEKGGTADINIGIGELQECSDMGNPVQDEADSGDYNLDGTVDFPDFGIWA